MKKIDLYVWLLFAGVVFLVVPSIDFYLLNMTGQQAAHQLAFPILAWAVLSVYYLARWSWRSLRARKAHKQAH